MHWNRIFTNHISSISVYPCAFFFKPIHHWYPSKLSTKPTSYSFGSFKKKMAWCPQLIHFLERIFHCKPSIFIGVSCHAALPIASRKSPSAGPWAWHRWACPTWPRTAPGSLSPGRRTPCRGAGVTDQDWCWAINDDEWLHKIRIPQ